MRKSCGTFNCSTQINVSILVLGNFDVRYKNKSHLFFVESELCIVPKSLWVISPTSEIVAHSNCSMKHLSFQHSSDFYSANIVIWLKERVKIYCTFGSRKNVLRGLQGKLSLEIMCWLKQKAPRKKGKIFENFCIGMKYVIFLLKIQFHFDYVGHNIVHIQGYQNKLETGAFHCQGPVRRGGLNVLHLSFKPFQTI